MSRGMISRALPLGLITLLLIGTTAAEAQTRRIYQTPDRWLTIEAGRLGVSRFLPDGPQGERNYGAGADALSIYGLINTGMKDTLDGTGLFIDPAGECTEQATTNLTGARGYAFTCRYRLVDSPPPVAVTVSAPVPPPVQAPVSPPAPQAPPAAARVAAGVNAMAPAKAAPVAKAVEPSPAPSPPASSATVAASLPPPPPEAQADQLNAQVKAALDAAEARDRQKKADYEAAKQKAADDFAKQMADHDAKVAAQKAEYEAKLNAQKAEYEANMAAWRARVAACKAGDASQCADSAVPPAARK